MTTTPPPVVSLRLHPAPVADLIVGSAQSDGLPCLLPPEPLGRSDSAIVQPRIGALVEEAVQTAAVRWQAQVDDLKAEVSALSAYLAAERAHNLSLRLRLANLRLRLGDLLKEDAT